MVVCEVVHATYPVFYYQTLNSDAVGGRGFSPATKSGPQLLLLENRRKVQPKEIPSRLIPRLLDVFTRQLEILVTTLRMEEQ